MNCTIPILPIDLQDCIGDSLGKHNYNALVLDTTICNLSSLMYNNINSMSNIFQNLSSIMQSYDTLDRKYNEEKVNHITLASSTVNLLSSFWSKYEFSVLYPLNAISLPTENLTILTPILSAVNLKNVNNLAVGTLRNFANSYLLENFDVNNFEQNAQVTVDVVFFLYNVMPNLTDSNINDNLTKITYSPQSFYDYNNRRLSCDFRRDNTHFTTGVILKYYLQDNRWEYNGYVVDNQISNGNVTAVSTPTTQTTTTTTPTTQTTTTTTPTTTPVLLPAAVKDKVIPCITLKKNKYYLLSDWSYIKTKATASKKAKIVMTFMSSKNSTSTLSYTANGYNKKTNTGGTDLYMEYDPVLNTVNVYEEHPTEKKLVQTWNAPFPNEEGVSFKFNFNSKTQNICVTPK
jgi:hypothetical protein